jgi:hypothetical protein
MPRFIQAQRQGVIEELCDGCMGDEHLVALLLADGWSFP